MIYFCLILLLQLMTSKYHNNSIIVIFLTQNKNNCTFFFSFFVCCVVVIFILRLQHYELLLKVSKSMIEHSNAPPIPQMKEGAYDVHFVVGMELTKRVSFTICLPHLLNNLKKKENLLILVVVVFINI